MVLGNLGLQVLVEDWKMMRENFSDSTGGVRWCSSARRLNNAHMYGTPRDTIKDDNRSGSQARSVDFRDSDRTCVCIDGCLYVCARLCFVWQVILGACVVFHHWNGSTARYNAHHVRLHTATLADDEMVNCEHKRIIFEMQKAFLGKSVLSHVIVVKTQYRRARAQNMVQL